MKGFLVVVVVIAAIASCEGFNGCPDVDPMNYTVHLPHATNCSLFYRCDHGYPKLDYCPHSLHFNPSLEVCDWPNSAGCTAGQTTTTTTTLAPTCGRLPVSGFGQWSPSACNADRSRVGQRCSLTCTGDHQLSGRSDIRCTEEGWAGANGPNQLPECKEVSDLGNDFIEKINHTLDGKLANLLFLLDESSSLSPQEFALEVLFMKALVAAFPLGANRSAGAITFSSASDVDVSIRTNDTCRFIQEAEQIFYSGGGTDILGALRLAITEVQRNGVHNFTLVFLITDGVSYTDPLQIADQIKNDHFALFTIGIGNFDPAQMTAIASKDENGVPIFFPIENFEVFEKVSEYLNTAYNIGALSCGGTSTPA